MWYETADGLLVEIVWYKDAAWDVRYRGGKVGRGVCSAAYCEEPARYLTMRSGRHWALCDDHARILTTGYWRPGIGDPDVMSTRQAKLAQRHWTSGEMPGGAVQSGKRP